MSELPNLITRRNFLTCAASLVATFVLDTKINSISNTTLAQEMQTGPFGNLKTIPANVWAKVYHYPKFLEKTNIPDLFRRYFNLSGGQVEVISMEIVGGGSWGPMLIVRNGDSRFILQILFDKNPAEGGQYLGAISLNTDKNCPDNIPANCSLLRLDSFANPQNPNETEIMINTELVIDMKDNPLHPPEKRINIILPMGESFEITVGELADIYPKHAATFEQKTGIPVRLIFELLKRVSQEDQNTGFKIKIQ